MDSAVFDSVLLNIADKSGSIDGFLNVIFSFLDRRTDFYDNAEAATVKVNQFLKKHQDIHQGRKEAEKLAAFRKEQERLAGEPRFQEVFDDKPEEAQEGTQESQSVTQAEVSKESEPTTATASASVSPTSKETSELRAPTAGNGAQYEKYSWTQTLSTMEIVIPYTGPGRIKKNNCDIKITSDRIKVAINKETYLEGKLDGKVAPDDCFWIISDGKAVTITLEKIERVRWWSRCVESEPKIDTSKVQPENSKLGDLDPETRQTVEKMMYEQHMKKLGRPSNEQEELLRKFQQAHPELDFSNAKIA
eukprot:Blabericola_migrator_1__7937@NODE_406_length_8824_cov_44_431426_g320_i0_p3_GENE_NODE_406_length_8824_cov_44_431426_g320_i0NODE_406_length_8824_cov_44_431426_g320_i0_p3_ORF_typecomplete_len305_score75_03Nudc_N/PF14050_6/3_5e16CS/PF04969_16/8_1e15EFGbinding_N/PF07299_11/3_5e02EFGbinding_N/PF07299_11/2_5Hid1/PF12722_7/0_22_NODE_406_length_8824_cov_44_431426_g320_i047675681